MTAYYNEIDKHAAAWLRELIIAGEIAPGVVDERDIRDIRPDELINFTQCHFFAGIGVWSHALRKAGWSDSRPVWTGSCPCQPFSTAGAGGGFADERHLWPHWHHLISECRPANVFGEQVGSKDGATWFDLVQTDMEGTSYSIGAVNTPSSGFGAPHIRQRIYWYGVLVNATNSRYIERKLGNEARKDERRGWNDIANDCTPNGMGNTDERNVRRFFDEITGTKEEIEYRSHSDDAGGSGDRIQRMADIKRVRQSGQGKIRRSSNPTSNENRQIDRNINACGGGGMADCDRSERERSGEIRDWWGESANDCSALDTQSTTGPVNGFWRNSDWLFGKDGKWRPVESGTFPLVNGSTRNMVQNGDIISPEIEDIEAESTPEARTIRLKGYGNAINAIQATEFIKTAMEYNNET